VLFDDAQYMRHGWINRNRILKPGGGWPYSGAVKKHMQESIKMCMRIQIKMERRIIGSSHYKKSDILMKSMGW
jgi:hypothetical protein